MKEFPLTKNEFKSIYTKVPRLTVDLIIVKEKRFLLTKRSIKPFKGLWHFPGGGVEYREKIREAINRIAKKELGVKVISKKFLGYIETLKDGYGHSVSLIFKCKIVGNKKPKPLQQASKISFFNKIPKKIIPKQEEFLKKNLEGIFD